MLIYEEKWEVKKLDSDNSFRLGVGVSSYYTPVISNVIRILERVLLIENKLQPSKIKTEFQEIVYEINNKSGNSHTLLLDGLRKNEVSASNLDKANTIIEKLKNISIDGENKMLLFNSFNGKKMEYNFSDSLVKLSVEKIPLEEKIKLFGSVDNYNKTLIINELKLDLKLFSNQSLRELLDEIVRNIFSTDLKLVLAHEKKGFKPLTNLKNIYCNRITSGLPRCKLI
ncbi:MAG: hypothetical protein Q4B43_02595 [Bacteroidota bacterium]|nr:hypothetical protein [Bacteroidota bacterium]